MTPTATLPVGPRGLFIDGVFTDAADGASLATTNPSTEATLAEVAQGGRADIERAVAAARRALEDGPWPRFSPAERGRLLWRIGDLILAHGDELALVDSLDNGKPLHTALQVDVPLAADMFHYYAGWATKLDGRTIDLSTPYDPTGHFHAYTRREPVGVVGQIIPWNYPLLMATWKLAPALATGNTVVLKPAEQTPLSALRLAELCAEAGLPPGVVNVVNGIGEVAGAALASHPGVDKVAFTGSTEVGRRILAAAGGNLKRLTLELGGKSPNIVFDDADIAAAIAGSASAIFGNHGQSCSAGSRLLVERSRFDEVVAGIADRAAAIRLGDGLDPTTEMGPLVSAEQQQRVLGYVAGGIGAGAEAAVGGARHGDRGWFVQPTVLVGAPLDSAVVREEIFGPVLVAHPFGSEAEAMAMADAGDYGLGAGLWTSDVSRAHRVAARLRAGTVWVNCYNVSDSALPFGGFKASGWGREMGQEALDAYTETKAVCVQL